MDIKHHYFHPEAHFFYENATGTGDVIKIWREGIHESKKCKYPAAEGKNVKFLGKYPGDTKIAVNSPWLLDYHEIALKTHMDQSKQSIFI